MFYFILQLELSKFDAVLPTRAMNIKLVVKEICVRIRYLTPISHDYKTIEVIKQSHVNRVVLNWLVNLSAFIWCNIYNTSLVIHSYLSASFGLHKIGVQRFVCHMHFFFL